MRSVTLTPNPILVMKQKTPKLKAQELITLFAPCTPHPKECAQIAINQMVHISSNMRYETTEGLFTHFKYWNLVKEEIEKL